MEPRVAGQLEASFIRISAADRAVVGAAFFVSEQGHVLTCAHVVAEALGIDADAAEKPRDTVHLDFPFLNAAACTARIEHWQQRTGPETNPSGDVAIPRLTTAPPDEARPARLSVADESFGREFRAYGYPKGYDAGINAYGVFRDQLSNGWLQVEDTKETGRRIEPGFSGGPVEDRKTGSIVGMVVASTRDKADKVGFVIPTGVLALAWPDLTVVAKERRRASVNTAPPMPPNFIPRPEELNELRQAVIGDQNTRSVALTGLRGMGGIGKTALAIALCHDDGLQEVFPDGVVWVDIGREPGNLAGKMRRVGQALGDTPGYYDTPEAGVDRLRLLLKDKAVLLVLDDVWDARHVEPFIVDAPRCRVLFTTRNADIALGLDAREMPLDVLAPEQAVALLHEWAKRDDPALPGIAKQLGYLPLALKLAGARLRGGMSGAEWLETFQRVSQIKLSRRSTDPQENLVLSFELSVRELPAEDRRLYYALGIFPEDVRTPQSVVGRLCRQLSPDLSQFDCDELVTELSQLALIERNADDKTLTLHDLLREYTREQLGDELAATHAALLSAYNSAGKPWLQIEDDGYLYYHLAYHLRGAGRKEELYKLLTEFPDWMEAMFVACTGDTAYAADLDLAIGDFAEPVASLAEVLMLVKLHTARQVVNARVSGYTDTDLRTLVWLGREDEALAHARLRSETKDRLDGLLIVYRTLKEKGEPAQSLLSEAREAANAIGDDGLRWEALGALAEQMARAGDGGRARETFGEAREAAGGISNDRIRWEALGVLAEQMARAALFQNALILLGLRELDDFLQTLATWAPSFEEVNPGLSVAVLREATDVVGWVRPDWRTVHELLSAPDHGDDSRPIHLLERWEDIH